MIRKKYERDRGPVPKIHCVNCGKELSVRRDRRLANPSRRCKECHLQVGHGHSAGNVRTSTYMSWQHLRQRCENTKCSDYKFYGGRGITVCDRWQKFENFLADMGPKPVGTSIDRINNNGNYEPGNCRWATRAEQMHNTRNFCGIGPRWRDGHFHTPQVIRDREVKFLQRETAAP